MNTFYRNFFKEQYLEEGNLDVRNLDGKIISKTGQNLPSQKPTSSLKTEKLGEHKSEKLTVLLRPTLVKGKKIKK